MVDALRKWSLDQLDQLGDPDFTSSEGSKSFLRPPDQDERAYIKFSGNKAAGGSVAFSVHVYLKPWPSLSRPGVVFTEDVTNREMDWPEFQSFLRDEVGTVPPDF